MFGAKFYCDSSDVIGELADAYPNSHFVGCSTSGEIFDSSLSDGTLSVAVAAFEGTTLKTLQRRSIRGRLARRRPGDCP